MSFYLLISKNQRSIKIKFSIKFKILKNFCSPHYINNKKVLIINCFNYELLTNVFLFANISKNRRLKEIKFSIKFKILKNFCPPAHINNKKILIN
jgi:hypothetical protein